MNYEEAIIFLRELGKFGMRTGLGRSLALSHETGKPERKFPIIHIAGTNGKGSVAAMIESILRHSGFHVGLYTSPHLSSYNERIRVGGRPIPKLALANLMTELKPIFERIASDDSLGAPTEFEIGTALAFSYFAHEKVDFAVVEVGLGGRLDSTNIVTPRVSVITSISREHTSVLGDTPEEIAWEKAGIIKQGVPVVIGPQNPAVLEIIKKIAHEKHSPTVIFGEDIKCYRKYRSIDGQVFAAEVKGQSFDSLRIPLLGAHQVENAGIAVGVIKTLCDLGIKIKGKAIISGLKSVSWPGRLEVLQKKPLVLVDGAHNEEGIARLKEAIREIKDDQAVTAVVGISRGKPVGNMISGISGFADNIIATGALSSRSGITDPGVLWDFAKREGIPAEIIRDPLQAVNKGLENAGESGALVVCGSIYLVGNVRRHLLQTAGVLPMSQRLVIFVGAFGSGKTEVALNYAKLMRFQSKKVAIIDFDIVNPYFRSREVASAMKDLGISVISSAPRMEAADLPSISPSVFQAFQDFSLQAVFDVGGDPTGAKALSGFRRQFKEAGYDMYFVLNTNRPFTKDLEDARIMLESIEEISQLSVTGIVSNTHLGKETTTEDVLKGVRISEALGRELDLPLVFACADQDIIEDIGKLPHTRLVGLDLHMRPLWERIS